MKRKTRKNLQILIVGESIEMDGHHYVVHHTANRPSHWYIDGEPISEDEFNKQAPWYYSALGRPGNVG